MCSALPGSQPTGSNGLSTWLRPTSHAPRILDLPAFVAERGLTGLNQPNG